MAPAEPMGHLYNSVMRGVDFQKISTDATSGTPNGAPLQLLPEIHGAHPNPAPSDHHNVQPGAKGAPELGSHPQTPDARALADKTLHEIALADGHDFAKPSRAAQDVVRQFLEEKDHLTAKDKASALKKLGPAFNQAISAADTNYIKIERQAEPAIKEAKELYTEANSNYHDGFSKTLQAAKNLPTVEQKEAILLLSKVAARGAEFPSKNELAKAFKDNPHFLQSLLQLALDQKAVISTQDRLDSATKPVLDAALEQDRTRLAYERAAQSVGDKNLAKSIDAERRLLAEQTKELIERPTEVRKVMEA